MQGVSRMGGKSKSVVSGTVMRKRKEANPLTRRMRRLTNERERLIDGTFAEGVSEGRLDLYQSLDRLLELEEKVRELKVIEAVDKELLERTVKKDDRES